MEMNHEKLVTDLLDHFVRQFNEYSKLVSMNYHSKCEESLLQWNRGNENTYEEEARDLAEKLGRKVNYELRKYKYLAETPKEFEIEYRAMYVTF